jgi:hypothetical protein
LESTNVQNIYSQDIYSNLSDASASKTKESNYSIFYPIQSQTILSVLSESKTSNLNNFLIGDPKKGCPKFYTNVPSYFLELFLAPEYNSPLFSTNDPEQKSYLEIRKNSETALLGFSTGLRFGMEFRNGLVLKSGLTYSDVKSRLDFQKLDVEVLKYKIVPSDTIHGNGSVAYVFDTIAYVEQGIRTVRNYNSIRNIEIPFTFGFQKNYIRWSIAINAGFSLQLSSNQSGSVISHSTLEPIDFTNTTIGHYKMYRNTWGLGLHASTQFGFKLNPNYQLIFEPYLKYYPRSITNADYVLSQRMLVYGTNLGLRMNF